MQGNAEIAQPCGNCTSSETLIFSGGSKNLKGGQKTIYQPRPHLSQMHTTIYRPFTRNRRLFGEKKFEPIWVAAPPPTFESSTAYLCKQTRLHHCTPLCIVVIASFVWLFCVHNADFCMKLPTSLLPSYT